MQKSEFKILLSTFDKTDVNTVKESKMETVVEVMEVEIFNDM